MKKFKNKAKIFPKKFGKFVKNSLSLRYICDKVTMSKTHQILCQIRKNIISFNFKKIFRMSDEQKKVLQELHEFLQSNVRGWQNEVIAELEKTKKRFSKVTISRTMNAYKSGEKPNITVVTAAKMVKLAYLKKVEEAYKEEVNNE